MGLNFWCNDRGNRCCREGFSISKQRKRQLRFTGTPNMGVDLWGEVDREVGQSPVRKRDSLRRQYAKCFFMSEVQGEGNCGRAIDRGKEACEM